MLVINICMCNKYQQDLPSTKSIVVNISFSVLNKQNDILLLKFNTEQFLINHLYH